MNQCVIDIVRDYAFAHLDKSDGVVEFDVFVVWQ